MASTAVFDVGGMQNAAAIVPCPIFGKVWSGRAGAGTSVLPVR